MSDPSFLAAFERVIGSGARDELTSVVANTPIVLISGDQCTGKGTAAALLVERLGMRQGSTGGVLRALAKEHGVDIESMSALLSGRSVMRGGRSIVLADLDVGSAEDVDVRLDFRAAIAIMRGQLPRSDGQTEALSVFESRLAGQLGRLLFGLGRQRLLSVYLCASPRVQAMRYLEREVFAPRRATGAGTTTMEQAAHQALQAVPPTADLATCLQMLLRAGTDDIEPIRQRAAAIAGRDDNDRRRLRDLYGVDYQDPSVFHLRIDTDRLAPVAVATTIMTVLQAADGDS
jgi:cytidylate kinase